MEVFEKMIKYLKQNAWIERYPEKVDKSIRRANAELKEEILKNKKIVDIIVREVEIVKGW